MKERSLAILALVFSVGALGYAVWMHIESKDLASQSLQRIETEIATRRDQQKQVGRFQQFKFSQIVGDARIDTTTGEVWLLLTPPNGRPTWMKIDEPK